MWGNKKSASKRIDSLVGKNTQITGDLDFSGGLLVDGKIIGNITAADDDSATITISENGFVQGEIQIPNVVINGTVEGNVYASNNVELAKKAKVYGNVYYNLFEMAMGAEVNGNLVHVTEEKATVTIDDHSDEPPRLEEPELFKNN